MSSHDVRLGRATARAGVAGNPSDALGGAALAVPIPGLWAEVELRDAPQLRVRSSAAAQGWSSVSELVSHAERYGHDGGDRLVSAAIVTLARYLSPDQVDESPFEATWTTNIPRSVGLAGSSAIVTACLRALCDRWDVAVEPEVLAALSLATESAELGVAAGWMDRAVQAHDAPTLVDTRSLHRTSGREVPDMVPVHLTRALELVVAWDPAGASPSGRLHGELHDRAVAGDTLVISTVAALVDAAERAADGMRRGDLAELATAVDDTCRLRDRLGALDARTAELAALARTTGAAATSAGSGGAVLAVPTDGGSATLIEAFRSKGISALPVVLGADVAAVRQG